MSIVIETKAGIGYFLLISQESFHSFKDQKEVLVYVYTQFVNDLFFLYGFYNEEERQFFKHLIQVSGVGPKMAIRALAHLSYKSFYRSILMQDVKQIASISGIGSKRAEKIILEMKDKLLSLNVEDKLMQEETASFGVIHDAIIALENFGFDSLKIRKTIENLKHKSTQWQLEDFIKEALNSLNKLK